MYSQIQKWGNGLGIKIPTHIVEKFNLCPGSGISIELEDNRIVIQVSRYHLDEMLEKITAKNCHQSLL